MEAEAEVTEEGVEAIEVEVEEAKPKQLPVRAPNIKAPSTQIFQQETGKDAACISSGDAELISAQNQDHVHGRTSSLPNETGTSPSTNSVSTESQFKIHCTIVIFHRKYRLDQMKLKTSCLKIIS